MAQPMQRALAKPRTMSPSVPPPGAVPRHANEGPMLSNRKVTTITLVLALGACSKGSDRPATLPDDLKRDLAAASPSVGDLAAAPQRFQPTRFVSSVERAHTATPEKRTVLAHHRTKPRPVSRPAPQVATEAVPEPVEAVVAESPAPVSTPEAPTPEPTVIAHQPTTEPTSAPSPAPAGSGGEVGGGQRGHGGGWGGLLGGLIGAVVIRGGIGGVDKCDPRTDGRVRPTVIDRPDFGMPIPTGQPTFPGSRRR
jgi:hypothetical protein